MPVVFRYKSFRFFFYSNEGNPREPLHVHVRSGEGEAKFWLKPAVHLSASEGYDARTLRELSQDGRTIAVPLAWFPRLLDATPVQRTQFELSSAGLHWDGLDEDISVAGLLAGLGDMTRHVAAVS